MIDRREMKCATESPVVRRLWPNEPDRTGVVINQRAGWAFSYEVGVDDDEGIFHFEYHPITMGEYLTITESDGERLPFKVFSCHN